MRIGKLQFWWLHEQKISKNLTDEVGWSPTETLF